MVMIVSYFVTMEKVRSKGFGKIAISSDMSISHVLLVESLNFNLLSMAKLCDLGFKCIFRVDDVEIISIDGSNLIFEGFRYENLYLVDFNASEAKLSICLFTKSSMGWYGIEGLVILERNN